MYFLFSSGVTSLRKSKQLFGRTKCTAWPNHWNLIHQWWIQRRRWPLWNVLCAKLRMTPLRSFYHWTVHSGDQILLGLLYPVLSLAVDGGYVVFIHALIESGGIDPSQVTIWVVFNRRPYLRRGEMMGWGLRLGWRPATANGNRLHCLMLGQRWKGMQSIFVALATGTA